jgi:hypothetical protein
MWPAAASSTSEHAHGSTAGAGVVVSHLRRWLGGFLLATALMGAGAWYWLDSIDPYVLDPVLGRLVPPPGHRHRFRSEGWAVTEYGRLGIAGIPDLSTISAPKVAIWGDSFVEGMHVPDRYKLAQQFTQIWQARHTTRLVGVGIGGGDRSVADYYHLIPRYESVSPWICHCIVLASLRDVCPDEQSFRSLPEFQLVESRRSQPWPGLRHWLKRWHLDFLWGPLWSLAGKKQNPLTRNRIRFQPGPRPADGDRQSPRDLAQLADPAAWEFLLSALKMQTQRPILFVYIPRVPAIEHGRVIWTAPEADQVPLFSACCQRHGIGFLDLSQSFVDYNRQTGRFPRGFANSIPGRGHLNRHGHWLTALAICEYLSSHVLSGIGDAVHSD